MSDSDGCREFRDSRPKAVADATAVESSVGVDAPAAVASAARGVARGCRWPSPSVARAPPDPPLGGGLPAAAQAKSRGPPLYSAAAVAAVIRPRAGGGFAPLRPAPPRPAQGPPRPRPRPLGARKRPAAAPPRPAAARRPSRPPSPRPLAGLPRSSWGGAPLSRTLARFARRSPHSAVASRGSLRSPPHFSAFSLPHSAVASRGSLRSPQHHRAFSLPHNASASGGSLRSPR